MCDEEKTSEERIKALENAVEALQQVKIVLGDSKINTENIKAQKNDAYLALYNAAVSQCIAINNTMWQMPTLAVAAMLGVRQVAVSYSNFSLIAAIFLCLVVLGISWIGLLNLQHLKKSLIWQRTMRISIERFFQAAERKNGEWLVGPTSYPDEKETPKDGWSLTSKFIKNNKPDPFHTGNEKLRYISLIGAMSIVCAFIILEILLVHAQLDYECVKWLKSLWRG
ncbi:hypothetical protein [Gayadomonas joobiniege]|uniref:hypothetical protein n=1 Tax=Gayadomonas joobiniege TaxID=1234606 RepID=UPI00036AAC6E|nr:hypothetical protein [Gayadomonas joobiniege]